MTFAGTPTFLDIFVQLDAKKPTPSISLLDRWIRQGPFATTVFDLHLPHENMESGKWLT
jgi:hypothetical protein